MRSGIGVLVIAAVAAVVNPASAAFFTYAEWVAMSDSSRAAYIAGLYDGLTSFISPGEEPMALHFMECISRAKMNNGQLAENVRTYASTRPELQGKPVGGALISYLHQLCGPPPRPAR